MPIDPEVYKAIVEAVKAEKQSIVAEVSESRTALHDHKREVWELLRGKTGANGLSGLVRRMERDMYRDPQTNSPGIVNQVKKIQLIIYLVAFSIVQNIPDTVGWVLRLIGGLP